MMFIWRNPAKFSINPTPNFSTVNRKPANPLARNAWTDMYLAMTFESSASFCPQYSSCDINPLTDWPIKGSVLYFAHSLP
jgi:hypothetical protein